MFRWFRRSRAEPELVMTPGMRVGWDSRAADKAGRLLWSKLTADQRATLPLGYFDVVGNLGGLYRISTSSCVQNITSRAFGRSMEFCAGPVRAMPRCDVWLCQKILIESDEGLFLRKAVTYNSERYDVGWNYW